MSVTDLKACSVEAVDSRTKWFLCDLMNVLRIVLLQEVANIRISMIDPAANHTERLGAISLST
ncbi:hypothetical protein [Rhodopirellula sp. MGV]|uniref:hypothetical protein n=1 Tax=Rhodopirellula sp. MGV TaxID=2023130 RepID=UPI000B95CBCD|nr:hypothetical protein [Rhodopirellula sp. MGV]OYP32929.1 hypothetical protein CGZ80_18660 [Rhodopirellula sp. MGV]OYP39210.1 hypothetical protein CGZ80_00780 [Rhodopirellula sp. MGV]PNY35414.1 hypothetical protein C2E31_18055 [Rhodopirellula baltica]